MTTTNGISILRPHVLVVPDCTETSQPYSNSLLTTGRFPSRNLPRLASSNFPVCNESKASITESQYATQKR